MKPTIDYQFILLFLAIWETDGNVNIVQTGVRAGDASFECGTELVLSCQIGQSSIYMTWQNDSSVTPLAECVMDTCTLDDTVAELYNITSDISTRTFNLTIFQVSFDNNNTIYTCSDGTDSNSTLARVKDYEPTVNESITGEIKVSCGCIDPSTKLSLEVIKLKSGSENESPHHPKSISPSFNTTACTGDINCVHSNFVQMSKWITVKRGGDSDYRLKVVFIYDGFRVESDWTKYTYEIEVGHFCMCDCYELLIVAGCAELIHIVLGVLLFVTWKGRDYSTKDKYFASAFEYLIVLCDLLWIVMFVLYIWSLIICFEGDCICSKIVRVAGFILLSLFGIHIILGCILLYVLYYRNRTVVNDDDKCSTSNATFIRSICSTIPVAGLFAVCQWLISVYRSEKPAKHNKKRDPIDKGKTEQKSSKGSEALPDISPKKSGRTLSESAQRRENEKIHKHFSTERSDLSRQSKGESDKISTSSVILKKKANVKNEFSKSNEPSTAVESARNNVPPNSTVDHNEKGTRSENRSHNGGSVTNSSSKKKKKTSRAKLERSTVDKTSREDPGKPLSTEEQTSTSHGNVKYVNVLDLKKKSDGSPSPSTEKSSYPSTSHITSQNSTKEAQIKSHSAEEHASTSHENVKYVTVLETKKKSDGRPRQSTEKSSNPSTSHITSTNSPNGDRIKSHSGEKHTK